MRNVIDNNDVIVKKMFELAFDEDIFKGDSIPNKAFSDELRRIYNQQDLEQMKHLFPNVTVIIDRSEAWFNVVQIPEWKEKQKAFSKIKMDWLKKTGTTE